MYQSMQQAKQSYQRDPSGFIEALMQKEVMLNLWQLDKLPEDSQFLFDCLDQSPSLAYDTVYLEQLCLMARKTGYWPWYHWLLNKKDTWEGYAYFWAQQQKQIEGYTDHVLLNFMTEPLEPLDASIRPIPLDVMDQMYESLGSFSGSLQSDQTTWYDLFKYQRLIKEANKREHYQQQSYGWIINTKKLSVIEKLNLLLSYKQQQDKAFYFNQSTPHGWQELCEYLDSMNTHKSMQLTPEIQAYIKSYTTQWQQSNQWVLDALKDLTKNASATSKEQWVEQAKITSTFMAKWLLESLFLRQLQVHAGASEDLLKQWDTQNDQWMALLESFIVNASEGIKIQAESSMIDQTWAYLMDHFKRWQDPKKSIEDYEQWYSEASGWEKANDRDYYYSIPINRVYKGLQQHGWYCQKAQHYLASIDQELPEWVKKYGYEQKTNPRLFLNTHIHDQLIQETFDKFYNPQGLMDVRTYTWFLQTQLRTDPVNFKLKSTERSKDKEFLIECFLKSTPEHVTVLMNRWHQQQLDNGLNPLDWFVSWQQKRSIDLPQWIAVKYPNFQSCFEPLVQRYELKKHLGLLHKVKDFTIDWNMHYCRYLIGNYFSANPLKVSEKTKQWLGGSGAVIDFISWQLLENPKFFLQNAQHLLAFTDEYYQLQLVPLLIKKMAHEPIKNIRVLKKYQQILVYLCNKKELGSHFDIPMAKQWQEAVENQLQISAPEWINRLPISAEIKSGYIKTLDRAREQEKENSIAHMMKMRDTFYQINKHVDELLKGLIALCVIKYGYLGKTDQSKGTEPAMALDLWESIQKEDDFFIQGVKLFKNKLVEYEQTMIELNILDPRHSEERQSKLDIYNTLLTVLNSLSNDGIRQSTEDQNKATLRALQRENIQQLCSFFKDFAKQDAGSSGFVLGYFKKMTDEVFNLARSNDPNDRWLSSNQVAGFQTLDHDWLVSQVIGQQQQMLAKGFEAMIKKYATRFMTEQQTFDYFLQTNQLDNPWFANISWFKDNFAMHQALVSLALDIQKEEPKSNVIINNYGALEQLILQSEKHQPDYLLYGSVLNYWLSEPNPNENRRLIDLIEHLVSKNQLKKVIEESLVSSHQMPLSRQLSVSHRLNKLVDILMNNPQITGIDVQLRIYLEKMNALDIAWLVQKYQAAQSVVIPKNWSLSRKNKLLEMMSHKKFNQSVLIEYIENSPKVLNFLNNIKPSWALLPWEYDQIKMDLTHVQIQKLAPVKLNEDDKLLHFKQLIKQYEQQLSETALKALKKNQVKWVDHLALKNNQVLDSLINQMLLQVSMPEASIDDLLENLAVCRQLQESLIKNPKEPVVFNEENANKLAVVLSNTQLQQIVFKDFNSHHHEVYFKILKQLPQSQRELILANNLKYELDNFYKCLPWFNLNDPYGPKALTSNLTEPALNIINLAYLQVMQLTDNEKKLLRQQHPTQKTMHKYLMEIVNQLYLKNVDCPHALIKNNDSVDLLLNTVQMIEKVKLGIKHNPIFATYLSAYFPDIKVYLDQLNVSMLASKHLSSYKVLYQAPALELNLNRQKAPAMALDSNATMISLLLDNPNYSLKHLHWLPITEQVIVHASMQEYGQLRLKMPFHTWLSMCVSGSHLPYLNSEYVKESFIQSFIKYPEGAMECIDSRLNSKQIEQLIQALPNKNVNKQIDPWTSEAQYRLLLTQTSNQRESGPKRSIML